MAETAGAAAAENRPAVTIRMLRPAPELSDFIDAYYFVETLGPMKDMVLASPGNIRFAPRGTWVQTVNGVTVPTGERAALFGPTDRTAMFGPTGPGLMLGAGLTPLGWVQLLDVPANQMSNRVIELGDIIGHDIANSLAAAVERAADDLGVAKILDGWLVQRATERPHADRRIAAVHRALLTIPPDVAAFAKESCISERTLYRLCAQAFGFPPKALLRQKRFQRTLERVRGVLDRPISGLIDDDYYDQAHFNRDFRLYMGMSPTAYFNSPREIMRRSADVRRTLNGAGIQGLHPASKS